MVEWAWESGWIDLTAMVLDGSEVHLRPASHVFATKVYGILFVSDSLFIISVLLFGTERFGI